MSDAPPLPPLTPHLTVQGGVAAIDFYVAAFGAEEVSRMMAEDGRRVLHAMLRINGGPVMLCDEFAEYGSPWKPPQALGGTTVALHLNVEDADALWQRAVDAGAEVVMPLADMFWGDRYGQLRDPFGHVWSIGAPIRR